MLCHSEWQALRPPLSSSSPNKTENRTRKEGCYCCNHACAQRSFFYGLIAQSRAAVRARTDPAECRPFPPSERNACCFTGFVFCFLCVPGAGYLEIFHNSPKLRVRVNTGVNTPGMVHTLFEVLTRTYGTSRYLFFCTVSRHDLDFFF